MIDDTIILFSCSLEQVITCYLTSLYAAFFMIILLHIGVLHGYMNFIGEIMRFADRQFYQVLGDIDV